MFIPEGSHFIITSGDENEADSALQPMTFGPFKSAKLLDEESVARNHTLTFQGSYEHDQPDAESLLVFLGEHGYLAEPDIGVTPENVLVEWHVGTYGLEETGG